MSKLSQQTINEIMDERDALRDALAEMPRPTVIFTPDKLDELRRFYEAAVKDGVETFHLDGNEYFVAYAKYLIEYLETEL